MRKDGRQFKNKKFTTFLLFIFVFSFGASFLLPRPTAAQVVSDPALTLLQSSWYGYTTLWDTLSLAREEAKDYANTLLDEFRAIFFKNIVGGLLNQVAMDAANTIASGGKGQNAMFVTDPHYWTNLGDSVAGDALNQFAKTGFGIDLCSPIDPKLSFNLLFAIEDPCAQFNDPETAPTGAPPIQCKPKCSLETIKKNVSAIKWDKIVSFSASLQVSTAPLNRQKDSILVSLSRDQDMAGTEVSGGLAQITDQIQGNQNRFSNLILKVAKLVKEMELAGFSGDAYKAERDSYVSELAYELAQVKYWRNTIVGLRKECEDNQVGCTTDPDVKTKALSYISQVDNWAGALEVKIKDTMTQLNDPGIPGPTYVSLADTARLMTPKGNTFGVFMQADSSVKMRAAKKKEEKQYFQMLQGRMNDVASTISGLSKTPSTYVNEMFINKPIASSTAREEVYTKSLVADAVGVFTNTLVNRMMQQALKGLVAALNPQAKKISDYPLPESERTFSAPAGCIGDEECSIGQVCDVGKCVSRGCAGPEDCGAGRACQNGECVSTSPQVNSSCTSDTNCPAGQSCTNGSCASPTSTTSDGSTLVKNTKTTKLGDTSTSAADRARMFQINTDLKSTEGLDYNVLANFAVCPRSPQINILPDNCVIDQGLYQAVQQRYSIQEALDKDLLHGNWNVGVGAGSEKLSYDTGYSLDNIKKLRKARIVPLGLEIAARLIKADTTTTPTLADVIKGFDVTTSSFYRLVDPNWVLKLPPTRCASRGYGQTLTAPESNQRQQICVDIQTCLDEDDNGVCKNAWGYCVKEKNVWRFDADSCPGEYNSCQTFQTRPEQGGQGVSYVRSSVTGEDVCNSTNVGCQWYSREYFAGDWQDRPVATSQNNSADCARAGGTAWNSSLGICTISRADCDKPLNGIPRIWQRIDSPTETDCLKSNGFWNENNNTCQTSSTNTTSVEAGVCESDRTYFNRNAGTCSADASGCQEFINTGEGTNFIANSDFEIGDDGQAPKGFVVQEMNIIDSATTKEACAETWNPVIGKCTSGSVTPNSGVAKVSGQNNFYSGASSLKIDLPSAGRARTVEYKLVLPANDGNIVYPGDSFTVSLYARSESGTVPFGLYLARDANVIGETDRSSKQFTATTSWLPKRVTLTVPEEGRGVIVYLYVPAGAGNSLYIDALMLERGTIASDYRDYGRVNKTYLKQAPAYLSCLGYTLAHPALTIDAATSRAVCTGSTYKGFWQDQGSGFKCYEHPLDAASCSNYALQCFPEEIGCAKYSPATGDPWISGIARQTDICPAECVGYATYKQKETNFMSAEFPLYFIPKTAKTCQAAEAGCDQFTNLDAIARGGEGIEYYTYLRQCQKPATPSNAATYYTWEGSDTTGYQLKVYSLINGDPLFAGEAGTNPPKYVPEFTDFSRCTEAVFQAGNLPDCRQFYDVSGNISYRLYTKTITSSDDCHPYRKTNTSIIDLENINSQVATSATLCALYQGDWNNGQCTKTEQECTQIFGGVWDSANGGQCTKNIFMAIPSEALSCNAAVSGCREYIGNAGNNVKNTLNDTFESGTNEDWAGGVPSNESTTLGGHSLYIPAGTTTIRKKVNIAAGKTYTLSFSGKKIGANLNPLTIRFASVPDPAKTYFSLADDDDNTPTAKLGANWNYYTLGPVFITWNITGDQYLEFSGLSNVSYLDNIMVKEVTDNLFLVKDSWQTPASCDTNNFGQVVPQAMLGCQAYKDQKGQTANLKSFSRVCREEAVGCELMIDTKNSSSTPFGQAFNAGAPDEDNAYVGADELVTMVNDPKKYCAAADKGCRTVGSPNYSQGRIKDFTDKYILDNPDNYAGVANPILCRDQELGCEEYRNTTGAAYFKKPDAKLCEYRTSVVVQKETVSGWFKQRTDEGCQAIASKAGDCSRVWDDTGKKCYKELNASSAQNCSYVGGIWRSSMQKKSVAGVETTVAACTGESYKVSKQDCQDIIWNPDNAQCMRKLTSYTDQVSCQENSGLWKTIGTGPARCVEDVFKLYKNTESNFNNWTGLCNETYNACSEFIDFDPSYAQNGDFETSRTAACLSDCRKTPSIAGANTCEDYCDYTKDGHQAGLINTSYDDPNGWQTRTGAVALDSQAHTGKSSVKIVKSDGNSADNQSSEVNQTIAGLKRGKTYIASVFFKAKPGVYGRLALGDEGSTVNGKYVNMVKKIGNGQWQKLEVKYTVPLYSGSGNAYSENRTAHLYGPRNACADADSNGRCDTADLFSPTYPDPDLKNPFGTVNASNVIVYSYPDAEGADYVLYDDMEVKEERNTHYYYLDNQRIVKDQCVEEDWTKGCVRFFNTNPGVNNYELVKVRSDRICGQWLYDCKGKTDGVCSGTPNPGIITCEEAKVGNASICVRRVDPSLAKNWIGGIDAIKTTYKNRDIGFRYGDYSGFSILDRPSIENINTTTGDLANSQPNFICRAYPVVTSPFPASVAGLAGFTKANICNVGTGNACECTYQQVDAGGKTIYYGANQTLPASMKICTAGGALTVGGAKKVDVYAECSTNADCNTSGAGDGICSTVTIKLNAQGVWGRCLEKDESMTVNGDNGTFPCLTWYPFKTCVIGVNIGNLCSGDGDCTQGITQGKCQ